MAVLQNQVNWFVYQIDSGGAVSRHLGEFTFDDNEQKAQQWAERNRKMWNVNKKTKIKVFRNPAKRSTV